MTGTRLARSCAALLRASHLAPTVTMTVVITGLCAAAGWTGPRLIVCAFAALVGQLAIGWTNDAHDAPLDAAAGRLSKPVVAGLVDVSRLRRAAVLMTVLVVPLSWIAGGWLAGTFHVVAVASALVYDLRLARTAWSWLPYAVSFACLAPYATLGSATAQWPPLWLPITLSLIGVGAHAANALPDLEDDRRAGVGGMAPRLGRTGTQIVAVGCSLGASVILVMAVGGWAGVAVLVIAVLTLVAAMAMRDDRVTFRLVLLAGLADLACVMLGAGLSR